MGCSTCEYYSTTYTDTPNSIMGYCSNCHCNTREDCVCQYYKERNRDHETLGEVMSREAKEAEKAKEAKEKLVDMLLDKAIEIVNKRKAAENMASQELPDTVCRSKALEKKNGYYQVSREQPIQIMFDIFNEDEFIGFLKGNILKYVMRFGLKDDELKEAEKIKQYATWLVEFIRDGAITVGNED